MSSRHSQPVIHVHFQLTEVVLHTLISRFRFEPAEGVDVQWYMYNFATPVVAEKPSLPLKVTLLVDQIDS